MESSKNWLWKTLPYPAAVDGGAEVEFSALPSASDVRADATGNFDAAQVFPGQECNMELTKMASEVTKKVYHLKYRTYTCQGALYEGTVNDNSGRLVEKWAVKRMDAALLNALQHMVASRHSYLTTHSRSRIPKPTVENPATEVYVMRELGNTNRNLQSIHEYLYCDGTFPMYFMVMPNAEGGSLLTYLKCNRITRGIGLPASMVYHIARHILNGLSHMHVNGLCHMDISPENVLAFPEEPRFVIHDFGLAIDSPIIKTDLLNPRGSRGKLRYWAPEVFMSRDQPYDGFKADIHSLGCTLYTLYRGMGLPGRNGAEGLVDTNTMSRELRRISNDSVQENWLIDRILEMVRENPDDRPSLEHLLNEFFVAELLGPFTNAWAEQRVNAEARQQGYLNAH